MEKVTKRITNWLIENGAVDDLDQELYEYAIYSILITISPLLVVLIIGTTIGTLLEGMIILLPFMCIRKFSGGYHTKNAVVCFISSCGILVLCMYLAAYFEYAGWITVIMTVCVGSLCLNSPIDSENKRLDVDEKRYYQKMTIRLSGIFYICHFLLVCIGFEKIATCLAVGICLVASLQLPCLMQFHSESEKGTAE